MRGVKFYSVLLLISLLQISPVFFYVMAPYGASHYEKAKNARFDECIEEKAQAILRYRNTIAPKEHRISGIDEARRLVDSADESNCRGRSSDLSDIVNFEAFALLAFFIVIPASGVLSKAALSSCKRFLSSDKSISRLLVLMSVLAGVVLLTTVGAITIWGLCLPAEGIPVAVKMISRGVGLPLLITTLVVIEALGRAFAYSGKRVHEELLEDNLKE